MTATTEEEFDFSGSYGSQVAKEANKGGDFSRELEFLTLKADPASINQGKDNALVRLVTNYEVKPEFQGQPASRWTLPWITVSQHYARTKQRPPYAKEGQTWPEKMYCVCRKDKVFAKRFHNQCVVCEQGNKASDRTWALGIEREQVIDNGVVIGTRDKMREVMVFGDDGKPIVLSQDGDKKTYQKKWVPAWVILNFGWKNFFNALDGQAQYFKTVLDRDFLIRRTGTGNNDTNYTFIAMDKITLGGDNPWGLAAGSAYDLGMIVGDDNGRPVTFAERLYPDMPDLRRIVAERVSDDYFGRWFVPGWIPEGFDPNAQPTGGGATQGVQTGYMAPAAPASQAPAQPQGQPAVPQQQAAPQQGASPEALEALRARVTGGAPAGGQNVAQEQPAAQQEAPAEQAPAQEQQPAAAAAGGPPQQYMPGQ